MMRWGSMLGLALAASCGACKPMVIANGSGGEASSREPIATIALATSGGNNCSARWNGDTVTQEAIMQRGVAALEEAIRTVGGVANITEDNLPFVRIEAPPAMAYPCLGATLGTLQRSGFAWVALRPAGGGGPDSRVDFLIADMPEPVVDPGPAVVIGRGSLVYRGAPSSLAAIRTDLSASSQEEETPPEARVTDVPPPVTSAPNGFLVEVGQDVPYIELYALARVVAEAGQTATVYSCAGPAGPRGQTAC